MMGKHREAGNKGFPCVNYNDYREFLYGPSVTLAFFDHSFFEVTTWLDENVD